MISRLKPLLLIRLVSLVLISTVISARGGIASDDNKLEQAIADRGKQFETLLQERKSTQELIDELKRQEWGVLEVFKTLNNTIRENLEKLNTLSIEIDLLEEDLRLATFKIEGLTLQIEKDTKRLHKQLYALFYLQKIRKMTLFLGAGSFENYFRNKQLLFLQIA